MGTGKTKVKGLDVFLQILIAIFSLGWIGMYVPYLIEEEFGIDYLGAGSLSLLLAGTVFSVIVFCFVVFLHRKVTATVVRVLFSFAFVLLMIQFFVLMEAVWIIIFSDFYGYYGISTGFVWIENVIPMVLLLLMLAFAMTRQKHSGMFIGQVICFVLLVAADTLCCIYVLDEYNMDLETLSYFGAMWLFHLMLGLLSIWLRRKNYYRVKEECNAFACPFANGAYVPAVAAAPMAVAPVAVAPIVAAPVAAPAPVEEKAPVAPVAVEEPVAPVAPVAVEEPVTPVVPVAVEEPVTPVVPVAVEEPVAPVAPVAVEEPAAPVAPVAVEEPVAPVAPVAVEEPVAPVVPVVAEEPKPMDGVTCPTCGEVCVKDAMFCGNCGTTLKKKEEESVAQVTAFDDVATTVVPVEEEKTETVLLPETKWEAEPATTILVEPVQEETPAVQEAPVAQETPVAPVVQPAAAPKAKFCSNCGTLLEEGTFFCCECGTRIEG